MYYFQIITVVNQKSGLQKISFIVHSVGGLVARYAIGRLYRPKIKPSENHEGGQCDENIMGTIYGLEAMNFITFATPHLGSRGNKQVRSNTFLQCLNNSVWIILNLYYFLLGEIPS